jgi:hypothetical protein
LARLAVSWALVSDALPLYPLYALLFAHAGLSDARISALFAIWSSVGLLAEVPAGALADRYSRRAALVVAGLLQGAGFAVWTVRPDFAGFATGFVLWGLGGTLVSGAFEAMLYDGLVRRAAGSSFPVVLGRVRAAGLLAQLPAALSATVLYRLGGFVLAGWASVVCCVAAAGLAAWFPSGRADVAAAGADPDDEPAPDAPEQSYLATLRAGVVEAAAHPAVRRVLVAVALLSGVDAIEEYFSLLARDWGVPTGLVPLATVGIPLAGAAGAALAGRLGRRSATALFGLAAAALAGSGVLGRQAGLALVALFYFGYRLVLVRAEAALQDRITGTARATVTSVAALGTEGATFALYGAWTVGGIGLTAGLVVALALALPWLLASVRGDRRPRRSRGSRRARSEPVASPAPR